MISTPEDSKPTLTFGLAIAAVILFFARHDLWLRDSAALVGGLPVSLLYHLVYCVLVSAVLAAFLLRKSGT